MNAIRNYAIFQASLPPGRPPAEAVKCTAEAIAASLRGRGSRVEGVERYQRGWSFEMERTGLRSIVFLARADHWLLVCEPRPLLAQRLLGRVQRGLASTVSELAAVLAGDARFRGVQWLTQEEYERGLGDPGPGADLEAGAEAHGGVAGEHALGGEVPGLTELLEEGEALVRPSLELSSERGDGPPIGIWRAGYAMEDEAELEHVVSVDCSWLARQGIPVFGTLSVFADGAGERCEVVQETTSLVQLQQRGGLPLWGREVPSFPPREALFCLGGKLGGSATSAALAGYDAVWWRRGLYREGRRRVVLGGWHLPWPDRGAYDDEGRVVLQTLVGSLRHEVWADDHGALTATTWCDG